MEPMIAQRCTVVIQWYHCVKILPNLDKQFDEPVDVNSYEWQKTSMTFTEAGLVETTKDNYYVDLTEFPIMEDDEIVVRGNRQAIKSIARYNHPMSGHVMGVLIC